MNESCQADQNLDVAGLTLLFFWMICTDRLGIVQ